MEKRTETKTNVELIQVTKQENEAIRHSRRMTLNMIKMFNANYLAERLERAYAEQH